MIEIQGLRLVEKDVKEGEGADKIGRNLRTTRQEEQQIRWGLLADPVIGAHTRGRPSCSFFFSLFLFLIFVVLWVSATRPRTVQGRTKLQRMTCPNMNVVKSVRRVSERRDGLGLVMVGGSSSPLQLALPFSLLFLWHVSI